MEILDEKRFALCPETFIVESKGGGGFA